jgi:hypothetical protein
MIHAGRAYPISTSDICTTTFFTFFSLRLFPSHSLLLFDAGRVKLGIHKHTGEQVAIKIISKAHLAANPAIEKAVRREIAIMKLVRHPNVMALVDVIDDPSSSDM